MNIFLIFFKCMFYYSKKLFLFQIWNTCLERIADRNACLYAVSDKTELYRTRGGFPIVESKWLCFGHGIEVPVNTDILSDVLPNGVAIEIFEDSYLSLIYDYDRKLIGYDRSLVIKLTCKEPDSRTYLAIKNGKCVGFGIAKISCQENALIGPLYADEKEVAEVLLKKLIMSLPQENGLSMATLSNNDAANEFAEKIGFSATYKCPILYRKKPFDTDIDPGKIYALFNCCFFPH